MADQPGRSTRNGPLRPSVPLGDRLALHLQELRRANRLGGDRPLLRIDNREEAAAAPYQFDIAGGVVHRRGCRSIPKASGSALYGLWRIGPEEEKLACPRCKPSPVAEGVREGPTVSSDLVYGVLSILDQFASVLKERGREYRETREGRRLKGDLEGLYEALGREQREIVDVLASALDGVLKTIVELSNGADGDGDRPIIGGRNGDGRASSRSGVRRAGDAAGRKNGHRRRT